MAKFLFLVFMMIALYCFIGVVVVALYNGSRMERIMAGAVWPKVVFDKLDEMYGIREKLKALRGKLEK